MVWRRLHRRPIPPPPDKLRSQLLPRGCIAGKNIIQKVLNEAPNFAVPVFKINVSEEDKPYVSKWLANQTPKIVLRGGGEIVLIETGIAVDFIRQMCYPGVATNSAKINLWLES